MYKITVTNKKDGMKINLTSFSVDSVTGRLRTTYSNVGKILKFETISLATDFMELILVHNKINPTEEKIEVERV